jgi:hypothetical protein
MRPLALILLATFIPVPPPVDEHLARHEQQLGTIGRELHSIRTELDDLSEKVENILGYRKEIDHALERIAVIEKNLGLERKHSA